MKATRAILYGCVVFLVGSATAPFWLPVIDLISFFAAAVWRRFSSKLTRTMIIPIEFIVGLAVELIGGIAVVWNLYSRLIVLEDRLQNLATIQTEIKELRQELHDFRNDLTKIQTIQEHV